MKCPSEDFSALKNYFMNSIKSVSKASFRKFFNSPPYIVELNVNNRTSFVVQWLRICLPMQRTWVQSLVQGDSTRCRATKSVSRKLEKALVQQGRPNTAKRKKKRKTNW